MNKHSVVAVLQRYDYSDEMILVSRKGDYKDLGLPGGKVEEGETPLQAIVREIYEETQIQVPEYKLTKIIEDKTCGEYLVDVYHAVLGSNYNDDLFVPFINSEDSAVMRDTIHNIVTEESSFREFNQDVWDTFVKLNILPWRTIEDVDLDLIIANLSGSCQNFIDSEVERHSNGNLDWTELTSDQLEYVDSLVMTCPNCGWNVETSEFKYSKDSGEDICSDCFEEIEGEDENED